MNIKYIRPVAQGMKVKYSSPLLCLGTVFLCAQTWVVATHTGWGLCPGTLGQRPPFQAGLGPTRNGCVRTEWAGLSGQACPSSCRGPLSVKTLLENAAKMGKKQYYVLFFGGKLRQLEKYTLCCNEGHKWKSLNGIQMVFLCITFKDSSAFSVLLKESFFFLKRLFNSLPLSFPFSPLGVRT